VRLSEKKKNLHRKGLVVAQGAEIKPQYHTKRKEKKIFSDVMSKMAPSDTIRLAWLANIHLLEI
jgi:hypothetical protein